MRDMFCSWCFWEFLQVNEEVRQAIASMQEGSQKDNIRLAQAVKACKEQECTKSVYCQYALSFYGKVIEPPEWVNG